MAPSLLPGDLAQAVAVLERGEVLIYPTETFYGLGVDALDEVALARLGALKGRGADKAISVLVSGPAMLDGLCAEIPDLARRLMAAHWPGPLTLALPARAGLPAALISDGCVAVRQSPHPLARQLVSRFGRPVTATSANRAGEPATTTAQAAFAAFDGQCVALDGGATPGGAPSTLVRVRGDNLEILRPGALKLDPP